MVDAVTAEYSLQSAYEAISPCGVFRRRPSLASTLDETFSCAV